MCASAMQAGLCISRIGSRSANSHVLCVLSPDGCSCDFGLQLDGSGSHLAFLAVVEFLTLVSIGQIDVGRNGDVYNPRLTHYGM